MLLACLAYTVCSKDSLLQSLLVAQVLPQDSVTCYKTRLCLHMLSLTIVQCAHTRISPCLLLRIAISAILLCVCLLCYNNAAGKVTNLFSLHVYFAVIMLMVRFAIFLLSLLVAEVMLLVMACNFFCLGCGVTLFTLQ